MGWKIGREHFDRTELGRIGAGRAEWIGQFLLVRRPRRQRLLPPRLGMPGRKKGLDKRLLTGA